MKRPGGPSFLTHATIHRKRLDSVFAIAPSATGMT
jgi:hypothetical protein